jgi:hypothetical protein
VTTEKFGERTSVHSPAETASEGVLVRSRRVIMTDSRRTGNIARLG